MIRHTGHNGWLKGGNSGRGPARRAVQRLIPVSPLTSGRYVLAHVAVAKSNS
jgi:hypothetical protein